MRERHWVKVTTQRRPDGKTSFIVVWHPRPGVRKRLCFTNAEQADTEADRLEALIQRGFASLATIPKRDLVEIAQFWAQKPDGVTVQEIIQSWKENHPAGETVRVWKAGDGFIQSRSDPDKYAERTRSTVRQHINRFVREFNDRSLNSLKHEEIDSYLTNVIGGVGKTRKQHLITIKSLFRWARDKKQWLPYGKPTAPEMVDPPRIIRREHTVYSAQEVARLLVFTPAEMVMFIVLGQFAGIRAEERLRLHWRDWRDQEDGKLVLNGDITKTSRRRLVDVEPNLALWLSALRAAP